MEYMESRMQDRYDGWDMQMAAADADLKAYAHNLARFGGEGCCLAIEEAWGVAGYPPQVVTEVLALVAGGKGVDDAIEAALQGSFLSPTTVSDAAALQEE